MLKAFFKKKELNNNKNQVKMATDGTDTAAFPEGDAEAELNLNLNKKFDVDPVSSEIAADKVLNFFFLWNLNK